MLLVDSDAMMLYLLNVCREEERRENKDRS